MNLSYIIISTIKKGRHKLFLWPWVEGDGQVETTTPSKPSTNSEAVRLEKVEFV